MLTLAVVALLTLTDPVGDLGNGTVRPPTAAVGRPAGALDVTRLELYDTEAVTFSVTFASLRNPFNLANGFTFPLIELYLDDHSGTGSTTLLPGSGMRLPEGATWKYAFKLTGDNLQLFEATANGWQDVSQRFPISLEVQGTSVVVSSSLPRPENLDLYGLVGSYSGFTETGWMPLSRSASPWAYSSESQVPAALDIITPTSEAQQRALATGVLPVIAQPRSSLNPWLFVMLGGVLIAITGVMLRFAPTRERKPVDTPPAVQPQSPGPYKPEPLKSRATALKSIAKDTPVEDGTPEATEPLMPGQQMAAERTRAMIVADRQARASNLAEPVEAVLAGETPNPLKESRVETAKSAELEKPVTVDLSVSVPGPRTVVGPLPEEQATTEEPQVQEIPVPEHESVSSSAIPLFETRGVSPLPLVKPATTMPGAKFDFGASGLETWHDYDDELVTFDWKATKQQKHEGEKPTVQKQKPDSSA